MHLLSSRRSLVSIFVVSLAVLFSQSVLADIYKTVDSEGRITFTNQIIPGAEKVTLTPITILQSPNKAPDTPAATTTPAATPPITHYDLKFTSPQTNQLFFKASGNVPVTIVATPAVQTPNNIVIYLDGDVIGAGTTAAVTLENLGLGVHNLEAKVVAAGGNVLARQSVSFNVFQPSNRRQTNRN